MRQTTHHHTRLSPAPSPSRPPDGSALAWVGHGDTRDDAILQTLTSDQCAKEKVSSRFLDEDDEQIPDGASPISCMHSTCEVFVLEGDLIGPVLLRAARDQWE